MTGKHKLLFAAATALVCVGITAYPPQLSGAGREVTVQVWGGAYEDTMRKYIVAPFEKETGAKVNVVLGDAPIPKLMAERGAPEIDVLNLSDDDATEAQINNLLEPPNPSHIPNAKSLYPEAIANHNWVVANWGARGIAYNTSVIKTAPTSWFDLWQPQYKGRVMWWDPSGPEGLPLVALFAEAINHRKFASLNDLQPAFDRMAALKPNIFAFAHSHADIQTAFTRGDIWFAPETNGRALTMKNSGLPIGFVMPKEGAPAVTSILAITRGSKNRDLAEKFINIALGVPAELAYATINGYAPSNTTVRVPENLQAYMPYGPAQVKLLYNPDYRLLIQLKSQITEKLEQILR